MVRGSEDSLGAYRGLGTAAGGRHARRRRTPLARMAATSRRRCSGVMAAGSRVGSGGSGGDAGIAGSFRSVRLGPCGLRRDKPTTAFAWRPARCLATAFGWAVNQLQPDTPNFIPIIYAKETKNGGGKELVNRNRSFSVTKMAWRKFAFAPGCGVDETVNQFSKPRLRVREFRANPVDNPILGRRRAVSYPKKRAPAADGGFRRNLQINVVKRRTPGRVSGRAFLLTRWWLISSQKKWLPSRNRPRDTLCLASPSRHPVAC